MTKSKNDNALTEEEFQELLDACEETENSALNKFIVLSLGKLGLRWGELGHLKKKWVDFEEGMIRIPSHEPCNCQHCQRRARLMAQENDLLYEEALDRLWRPKTEAAARTVPFRSDSETAKKMGGFPLKTDSISRIVNKITGIAGLQGVHPLTLRATAAKRLSDEGLDAPSISAIMGWKDAKTASRYVELLKSRRRR